MSRHLGDSTSDAIQLRRHSKKSCVRNTCDQTTRHTSLLRTDPVAVRYSTLLSSQCGTAVRAHKEVSASQVSTGLLTLDHSRVISRGQDQPSASEDSLHDRTPEQLSSGRASSKRHALLRSCNLRAFDVDALQRLIHDIGR
jgi:hypothetical protein